jgi:hypothetical protein
MFLTGLTIRLAVNAMAWDAPHWSTVTIKVLSATARQTLDIATYITIVAFLFAATLEVLLGEKKKG